MKLLSTIRRSLTRMASPGAVRSFDGGAGGRRWKGAGEMASQPNAALAARATVARRARYLVGNNALARAGVEAWASALVGSGIKPQSQHPDPNTRAIINAAFERWTDAADADGLLDLYGMQALAASRMVTDGEALAVMQSAPNGSLRIRLLDPEQLDGAMTRELSGGGRIIAGVEFDAAGNRVAYHIFPQRPGLNLAMTPVRVDAAEVLHLFRVDAPGQVRGLSWFAPVLLRLNEYDQSVDAQLVRQKIAALLAGFIVDPEGRGADLGDGGASLTGALEGGMEPGLLKALLPGQDIRFSDPAPIGSEGLEFLRVTAREIASGLGVPYEALTGDLSSVNYSSIRAGLVEFRRRAEAVQFNTLVFQFLRPVWRRWLLSEILSERINAPGFASNAEDWLSVKWIVPKQAWVDPLKDAQAEATAIAAGLMSRREAIASRGYDIEQVDAEIAADNARAKSLGLTFTNLQAKESAA